jgi:hypothetical protein
VVILQPSRPFSTAAVIHDATCGYYLRMFLAKALVTP